MSSGQARRARRIRLTTFLRWLKEQPCLDCGQRFSPWVMDFDHRDPATKRFEPARLNHASWDAALAEVQKCDVVCANCHRDRTHRSGHCRIVKREALA